MGALSRHSRRLGGIEGAWRDSEDEAGTDRFGVGRGTVLARLAGGRAARRPGAGPLARSRRRDADRLPARLHPARRRGGAAHRRCSGRASQLGCGCGVGPRRPCAPSCGPAAHNGQRRGAAARQRAPRGHVGERPGRQGRHRGAGREGPQPASGRPRGPGDHPRFPTPAARSRGRALSASFDRGRRVAGPGPGPCHLLAPSDAPDLTGEGQPRPAHPPRRHRGPDCERASANPPP